jgi:hypothetical protein
MSAFANITLVNNAAANVVFYPMTIVTSTGVAMYATSDAVFDAKSILTISTKQPAGANTRAKYRAKVTIPVMDAVYTTKKIDEAIVTVDFSLPRDLGSTPRLDARAYIKALIADAVTTAFLTSYEGIY